LTSTRLRTLAMSIAVFTAGAVLLGVEIAASRVLAPFFGSSLFVWGSLIGIVLAGLSLGYWLGGIVADRLPRPGLLVGVLTVSAALVLAIPFVDRPILDFVVRWDPGPRLNPVLATILLFGLAAVVMGTVSPIAVRLRARSIDRLGHTAGRLFALSTAGSIGGTFATSFWLIPELGTDQVLAVGALALVLSAALVAAAERLVLATVAAAAIAAVSVAAVVSLEPDRGGRVEASQFRNWSPVYRLRTAEERAGGVADASSGYTVRYAKDSRYHRVVVADDDDTRYLRFDSSFQSGMWLDDPYKTRFAYTDYLQLALAYRPQAKRILFVGLGGGSVPKRMWRDFPQLRLDVVELDPDVVDVTRRFFALPDDERLNVVVEDGRRFVAQTDERWDAIVLDAFYSDSIPFHLATREFLELAQSRLAPGGVVVSNIIGAVEGRQSRLFRSMVRTYRSVFPSVAVHPVVDGPDRDWTEIRNIIVVTGDGAVPRKGFLERRWAELRKTAPGAPDLTAAIRFRYDREIPTRDVPLLTDDYAPTDALLLLFG
jgi:spermidine synthase